MEADSTPETTKVSEHFTLNEVDCNCGCGASRVDVRQLPALEQMRLELGKIVGREVPLIVNSFVRCPSYNRHIGGASNSKHLSGKATDVRSIPSVSVQDLFLAALRVPTFLHGGIGVYASRGFVHVDCRGYKSRWQDRGSLPLSPEFAAIEVRELRRQQKDREV